MKLCSSYLSFCPTVSFLGISSLVFETLHNVIGPCVECISQSQLFLGKSLLGKNDQKWPLNRVFQHFSKISFVWKMCYTKVLMLLWHYMKNACLGKIYSSSCGQNCSRPVRFTFFFFSSQYFINWLTSGFDFWM